MASYIIITPAYNEAAYIGKTIDSVLAQTVKPLLWVIVDDGSTDQTPELIQRRASEYPWILYVRRSKDASHSYYSSNVYAIFEGLKHLPTVAYDFLAILDADIEVPAEYYESILDRMASDEKVGIASGVYLDRLGENQFRKPLHDRRSTPKALMVFRSQCYEAIGGFVPMKYGGEDTIACFSARMHGWKAWSFPDIVAIHHKPIGTGHTQSLLKIRFRQGICEYFLATQPFFMLVKSLRRCIKESPLLIGGLVRLSGYIYAFFSRERFQLSPELVRYIRGEQLSRVFKGNAVPAEFVVETPPKAETRV